MSFIFSSNDFVEYLKQAGDKIAASKDYISELDAVTGDGDHWANMNLGFQSILASADELAAMPMWQALKQVGMTMMSKIGGSSGILYGGAYMAAAKALKGKSELESADLCTMLGTMVNDMMQRGKAEPGYKTMIDALYPAAEQYKKCLEEGVSDAQTMEDVKRASLEGAEATRKMEAVKGRASYQTTKGVGHLDPGAVTMSYQIECLTNYIANN